MNPADRLIVALDVSVDDAFDLVKTLRHEVSNFKIGAAILLQPLGYQLVGALVDAGMKVMLDLKLYDTRDTVKRTMEVAANLGVTMVAVYADCVEHAIGFGPKVLAVCQLTDGTGGNLTLPWFIEADGIVCSTAMAKKYRVMRNTVLVCPGIRPAGIDANNHVNPSTPGDAIRNGADYIVVGRPIWAAADPVAAARAITLEIEAAEGAIQGRLGK